MVDPNEAPIVNKYCKHRLGGCDRVIFSNDNYVCSAIYVMMKNLEQCPTTSKQIPIEIVAPCD